MSSKRILALLLAHTISFPPCTKPMQKRYTRNWMRWLTNTSIVIPNSPTPINSLLNSQGQMKATLFMDSPIW